MRFLANENFPLKSILYLKGRNFDIFSIGQEIPGIKEEEVISIAYAQDRTILTFDRDYGELIFKHNLNPKKGVIYFRLFDYSPKDPGIILEELTKNGNIDFDQMLTVIDKNGIRQRKY